MPSPSPSGKTAVRSIAPARSRLASLDARKSRRKPPTLLAQAAELEKTLPTREVPMACAVKEGETMNQHVFLRGDYHSLGRSGRTHRALHSPSQRAGARSQNEERPPGTRRLDCRSSQSAAAARHGQPHLAGALRRWHCRARPITTAAWANVPRNPELLDYLAKSFHGQRLVH